MAKRLLILLALAVTLLAGCSDNTAQGEDSSPTADESGQPAVPDASNTTIQAPEAPISGPPQTLYLGRDATTSPCTEGQDAVSFGTLPSAGNAYWNFTFASDATVLRANATIWMEVHEAFALPTSMGWSYQNNDYGSYRLGGDYWGSDQPLVQPGLYRIEQASEAFGNERERTLMTGESMGIHWNPTNFAVSATPAYTVLCEPDHMSQMWIEYA